jgi:predicted nucleic acid-binding protein
MAVSYPSSVTTILLDRKFEWRVDKEWTLTDRASFVVMQQRGLTEAISADHHFEQTGFIRLLK